MGKIGEHTKCPWCDGTMTLDIERGPDPEQVATGVDKPEIVPLKKRWKCDDPKCGRETEESFPTDSDFF